MAQEGIFGLGNNRIQIGTDKEENAITNKGTESPINLYWEQEQRPPENPSPNQNPGQLPSFSSAKHDSQASQQYSNKATTLELKTKHSNGLRKRRTISDSLTSCLPCIPRARSARQRQQSLRQLAYAQSQQQHVVNVPPEIILHPLMFGLTSELSTLPPRIDPYGGQLFRQSHGADIVCDVQMCLSPYHYKRQI